MAVPLACLLLTLAAGVHAVLPANSAALTGGTSVYEATVIEAGEMRRTVDVGSRSQAILEPQTRLRLESETHVAFLSGEAILSVPGYAVLALGDDRSLVLLDATVWVRRDDTDWTIVPLDVPVVLQTSDALSIIPPAQQRRVGTKDIVSPVPMDWLLQKIADATSLAVPHIAGDGGTSSSVHDPASLAALLHSQALLSHKDLRSALSLVAELDHSGVLSGLIAYRLGCDPSTYDDEAAVLLSETFRLSPLSGEVLTLLPSLVGSQVKPVSDWLLDEWSEEMMRQGIDDPFTTIVVLRRYADLPVALRSGGYPLQSERWRAALANAEQTLLPLLTANERISLDSERRSDQTIHAASSDISVPAVPRFTEKQLLAVTRQMLANHGVLMGSATRLLPLAGPPQAVRVVGVFIAERGRDVPYEFIFDPTANVLSKIIRDGVEQPNTVPVETFFEALSL